MDKVTSICNLNKANRPVGHAPLTQSLILVVITSVKLYSIALIDNHVRFRYRVKLHQMIEPAPYSNTAGDIIYSNEGNILSTKLVLSDTDLQHLLIVANPSVNLRLRTLQDISVEKA